MDTETDGRAPEHEISAHIASCVIRVTDLNRSLRFYCDVFACRVVIREADMALLLAPNGFQIYLRSGSLSRRRGAGASGVQYLMWATESQSDLQRITQRLRAYDVGVFSHTENGVTFVEGDDPDGARVIVAYPSPRQLPRSVIAARIRN